MEPIFNIRTDYEPPALIYHGKEVVSLEYCSGLWQYSFSTPKPVGKALKKTLAFLENASKKMDLPYAITKLEVMDDLRFERIFLEKEKLSDKRFIDDLCSSNSISFRLYAKFFSADVESALCEPGYLPIKKRNKSTRVRIRAKDDIALYLPEILINLGVAGLTAGTRFHLERYLKELVDGHQK